MNDAFKFVKDFDFKAKQDIIFVDIFAYNQLPSDVFSKDFLKQTSLVELLGREKSIHSAIVAANCFNS